MKPIDANIGAFPEDIEAAAWKVADVCNDYAFYRDIYEATVKALMAERERAAHLVETWAEDNLTVQPSFTNMAAAIRQPA